MLTPHKAQPSRQAKTTGCYIPLKAISPLKRNHIQRLDVTQEGSPSKRMRFHDKSVLSSTRTDDPGCGDEVPHLNRTRSCSSRQRMYDNHRQYYRSSDMGPANGYCSTVHDPIVSHSGNCRGSCCQTRVPQYKARLNIIMIPTVMSIVPTSIPCWGNINILKQDSLT